MGIGSEEIKNRCEQIGLEYISHYSKNVKAKDKIKKQTYVNAKCGCGNPLDVSLSSITRYSKENKIYSLSRQLTHATHESQIYNRQPRTSDAHSRKRGEHKKSDMVQHRPNL